MAEEIDSRKARQALIGRRGFVILVASMILVFVAWAIADIYFFRTAPGDKEFPAEQARTETQKGTTPEQHLDNPKQAVPRQTKPLPKNLGGNPPGATAR